MDVRVSANSKHELNMLGFCRSVAECSPMPMAALERTGHLIRYVNAAFCSLTDKTSEALIGSQFCSTVPAGEECLPLLDRVYETGQAEIYTGEEDAAHHPLYWSYTLWPILGPGDEIVGVMFQVTETADFHKQATSVNQALMVSAIRQHELTEQAESLNEQLRRMNEDLKQFAFAASHDLQEPLRMMTIYSQLLLKGFRGQLDGQAGVCVDFVTKGAKRMQALLADLLAYAEASVESAVEGHSTDLNTIFERVKQNCQGAIEESSAVVTSDPLPLIQGQEAHFVQVFENLISNAIKYRGDRAPRIHVSAEQKNGGWRFAVADNGIGIPPDHHQEIFGVFKRLHGNTIPGTGMGLAICQRVLIRYGGRIWVESQEGQGATFYFTLPGGGKT